MDRGITDPETFGDLCPVVSGSEKGFQSLGVIFRMGPGFAFSVAFTPTAIGLRAVQTGFQVCFGRFRGSVTGYTTGGLSARFMRWAVPQRPVYQFELDHRPS